MGLRDSLSASSDVWTDGIDVLLEDLSDEILQNWEVYERGFKQRPFSPGVIASNESHRKSGRHSYPSDTVQFGYLPDSIEPTKWIVHTNFIRVSHRTRYDSGFDIDSDGNRRNSEDASARTTSEKESKYVVSGTFVDPIVTRSIEKVNKHLPDEMDRISEATALNAEIERLSYPLPSEYIDPPNDPSEYTDQNSPVTTVDGVGTRSIERLAERFGTYYNVTIADIRPISECLSSWHNPSTEPVVESIEEVISRYNQFRERNDWDGIDLCPNAWTQYPKEQPR